MPGNVNYAFRELGIILFLACVGLKAGSQFVNTLLSPSGLLWLVCGALITIIPVLVAGIFGRAVLKLNYMTILGLQAGSMTDPPALAFANTIAASHTPAISYASVYPLTMLLRITVAQFWSFCSAGNLGVEKSVFPTPLNGALPEETARKVWRCVVFHPFSFVVTFGNHCDGLKMCPLCLITNDCCRCCCKWCADRIGRAKTFLRRINPQRTKENKMKSAQTPRWLESSPDRISRRFGSVHAPSCW